MYVHRWPWVRRENGPWWNWMMICPTIQCRWVRIAMQRTLLGCISTKLRLITTHYKKRCVSMSLCVCACVYVRTRVYICMCVCVYMCVYVYVCVCVCVVQETSMVSHWNKRCGCLCLCLCVCAGVLGKENRIKNGRGGQREHVQRLQGCEDLEDALSCRSLSANEPLSIFPQMSH